MARAYAIDFVSDASGKHIKSSKYRVMFRFGFSPNEYPVLEQEHVVTFSWSAVSGKAILSANGQDVHMTDNIHTKRKGLISSPKILHKKQAKFEHNWDLVCTDFGGQSHSLGIVANSGQHHYRQFDLFIDGVSYFDLPKYNEQEGRIIGLPVDTAADTADNSATASSPGSQPPSIEEANKPTITREGEGGDNSWLDIDANDESSTIRDKPNDAEDDDIKQLHNHLADLSQ